MQTSPPQHWLRGERGLRREEDGERQLQSTPVKHDDVGFLLADCVFFDVRFFLSPPLSAGWVDRPPKL